jgi:uncharacterized damage-inducible protein DinB
MAKLVQLLDTQTPQVLIEAKIIEATEDFQKTFLHPVNGPMTLDRTLQIYAWHGKHHAGQILALKDARGWT